MARIRGLDLQPYLVMPVDANTSTASRRRPGGLHQGSINSIAEPPPGHARLNLTQEPTRALPHEFHEHWVPTIMNTHVGCSQNLLTRPKAVREGEEPRVMAGASAIAGQGSPGGPPTQGVGFAKGCPFPPVDPLMRAKMDDSGFVSINNLRRVAGNPCKRPWRCLGVGGIDG